MPGSGKEQDMMKKEDRERWLLIHQLINTVRQAMGLPLRPMKETVEGEKMGWKENQRMQKKSEP